MTFDTYFVEYLEKQGLWPDEARNVVDIVKGATPEMQHRWDDDVAGYPSGILAILSICVRKVAFDYLTEHRPLHFVLAGLVP